MKNFKDVTAINAQLLDKNKHILRINQILNINDDVINTNLDVGSETSLITSLEVGSKANFNLINANKTNLISEVLAIEADKS